MALNPIPNFTHFETHHCVTGSMRHLYAFYGHDTSEDLLLGLGEGDKVGIWFKGASEHPTPAAILTEVVGPLKHLADLEQATWEHVAECVEMARMTVNFSM
jgi:hypothetical protein